MSQHHEHKLTWIRESDPLPQAECAWDANTPAPGLVAAGQDLSVARLKEAYTKGLFPWFNNTQPVLWWSTDPRMVLKVSEFKLHRSLKKTLCSFMTNKHCDIRMNTQFARVIEWCAQRPSKKNVSQGESIASQSETQDSSSHAPAPTWIVPQMQEVYTQAHHAGLVHSVETWIDQELVGGLYFVAIGSALYGESMFSRQKDASKIALAALVAFCKAHGIEQIDCQQNTAHLASLGAAEVPRAHFLKDAAKAQLKPPPTWRFDKSHWHKLGI